MSQDTQATTEDQTMTPAAAVNAAVTGVAFAPAEPAPGGEAPVESEEKSGPPADRRKADRLNGGVDQRKNVVDRRTGLDRRVIDLSSPTGLERRRGPGRRLSDDRKSAEEGEMSDEQFEFVMAVDTYKRLNNRPFPTWTEVLEVVKQLGYRKVEASTIKLPNDNGRAARR